MRPTRVFGSEQFTQDWKPQTAQGMVYVDIVMGYDDNGNPITITKAYPAVDLDQTPPPQPPTLVTALQHDSGVTRNVPAGSVKEG